jgi:hypothetical protein
MTNNEQTKKCTKCNQEKPLSEFHKDKRGRLGRRPKCKTCETEQKKRWRQENKDKVAEREKQYYQENKDKIAERKKQYYQENKDKVAEQKKRWRQKNKDKIAEQMKRWRQENKDKVAEQRRRYRQKNKDKIAEQMKQYYQDNKDKIAEREKQYRQNLPSMIYEIQNTITKQIYVGQTSMGLQRWNKHKVKLRKGIHKNPKLQKSWNIWGEDAFCFNVVEELPPDFSPELLLEKETALILEHASSGTRLYNVYKVCDLSTI